MRSVITLLLLAVVVPAADATEGAKPKPAETSAPAATAEVRTVAPPKIEPILEVRQSVRHSPREEAREAEAAQQPPRGWWWTVAAIVAAGIILAVLL